MPRKRKITNQFWTPPTGKELKLLQKEIAAEIVDDEEMAGQLSISTHKFQKLKEEYADIFTTKKTTNAQFDKYLKKSRYFEKLKSNK